MTVGDNQTVYEKERIGLAINLYYPPILIVFGSIGNALTFIVYIKPKFRGRISAMYIASLAVLDTVMLYIGLLQYWILFNFASNVLTHAHCKGMFFVVNFVGNYSHWVIVLFTVDRFFAVCYPLKCAHLRTKKRGVVGLATVGSASFMKNLHYLWTTDFFYNEKTNTASCAFGLKNKAVWVSAYQFFEVTVSSIIPFAITLVINSLIIYQIRIKRKLFILKFRKNSVHPSTASSLRDKSLSYPLTRILIAVSMVFVVTTCPLLVFRLYYAKIDITKDPEQASEYTMWHHILHKLWYTNNGVNFLMYSVFSKTFRRHMKTIFKGMTSNSQCDTN